MCLILCRGSRIALDIAAGLVYLHSKMIVHLDLKSPNVLLAADYTAKIAGACWQYLLHFNVTRI